MDDNARKSLVVRLLKASFSLLAIIAVFPMQLALELQIGYWRQGRPESFSAGDWFLGILGALLGLAALASALAAILVWRRVDSKLHKPGRLAYLGVAAIVVASGYILALPWLANRIPWATM
jgi:hypothetical protein